MGVLLSSIPLWSGGDESQGTGLSGWLSDSGKRHCGKEAGRCLVPSSDVVPADGGCSPCAGGMYRLRGCSGKGGVVPCMVSIGIYSARGCPAGALLLLAGTGSREGKARKYMLSSRRTDIGSGRTRRKRDSGYSTEGAGFLQNRA